MLALQLAEELRLLVAEADKKQPPPKPSREQIGATLRKMSTLAHQQTKHALRINSPAAHALAAKTHMRVAQAAKRHNYLDLHKQHSALAKGFRDAAKPSKETKSTSPIPKAKAAKASVPPAPIPKQHLGKGPPGGPPPKVAPVRPRRGNGPPGGPPPNVPPVRPQSGGNVHHRSTRNAPRRP